MATFMAGNAFTPGVVRTLRHLDVWLPKSLCLICFDDVERFSFLVLPKTAMRTAYLDLGQAAVGLLLPSIEQSQRAATPPVLKGNES